jgi:glycosyltransferase involved in cell wall biosynthesis
MGYRPCSSCSWNAEIAVRILSILPLSPPTRLVGGAELQMHCLHKGLTELGHQVDVLADIASVGAEHQKHEGVTVWGMRFPVLTSHLFRPGNARLYLDWRDFRSFVERHIPRPDIVQVSTFRQPALWGHLLAEKFRVPWVVRLAGSGVHGDFSFCDGNWLLRHWLPTLVSSVTAVVALENNTRAEAIGRGVDQKKVVIIPNGLVSRQPKSVRQCFDSNAVAQRAVYLGRLANGKRIATLIAAWQTIAKSLSNAELLLIGDGECRVALEELVQSSGQNSNIRFCGHVNNPQDYLEGAHLLINPSESEGMPNAVLEAAALGVPAILSDIPIHRQISLEVGMDQFLFPVGDTEALAAAITRFFASSHAERRELTLKSMAFGNRFSSEKRNTAYLSLYQSLTR